MKQLLAWAGTSILLLMLALEPMLLVLLVLEVLVLVAGELELGSDWAVTSALGISTCPELLTVRDGNCVPEANTTRPPVAW